MEAASPNLVTLQEIVYQGAFEQPISSLATRFAKTCRNEKEAQREDREPDAECRPDGEAK